MNRSEVAKIKIAVLRSTTMNSSSNSLRLPNFSRSFVNFGISADTIHFAHTIFAVNNRQIASPFVGATETISFGTARLLADR